MPTMNLTVVTVRVGMEPATESIENTLRALQGFVGGYIEAIRVFDDDKSIILVCNKEGRLLRMPINRSVRDDNGVVLDAIYGDFMFCAANSRGEFCSLTERQAERCKALLA